MVLSPSVAANDLTGFVISEKECACEMTSLNADGTRWSLDLCPEHALERERLSAERARRRETGRQVKLSKRRKKREAKARRKARRR